MESGSRVQKNGIEGLTLAIAKARSFMTTMANDLIYDVGMHNGNDTAFYLARGFRVLGVEADPGLVAGARKRFEAEIAAGRLTILNVALAEKSGRAVFWINEVVAQLNSFDRELTARFGHPVHSIEVQCRRLDDILAEHGTPYYLKIDIEGHDLICCQQLKAATRPQYISVEMSRIELLYALRDLGYDQFRLITQRGFEAIKPGRTKLHVRVLRVFYRLANYHKENRNLALRMSRIFATLILQAATFLGLWGPPRLFRSAALPEWNFISGESSGTFGDDLPGEWLTADDIEQIWNRDVKEYEKMGVEWYCDLHATTSSLSAPAT